MDIDGIISDFYKNEKGYLATKVSKVIRLRKSETEKDYILAYSYFRWLDDLIDKGNDIDFAEQNVIREEGIISRLYSWKNIIILKDYDGILKDLYQKYGKPMMGYFQRFIDGFKADIRMIKTEIPLKEDDLKKRNINLCLPAFKTISMITYGKKLEYSKNFEELMNTLIMYDGIKDIDEDLSQGIILFSQENLNERGIKLVAGGKIPPEFEGLYKDMKKITIKNILTQSKSVKETNLPILEKMLMQSYFITRAFKLLLKNYKLPDIIYKSRSYL